MTFIKAVKRDAKGRVALVGPAGSGKSYTMLLLARALAGPTGKIAAIDTEHGSLSKYAHSDECGGPGKCPDPSHFDFDVCELSSFSPENFLDAIDDAGAAGYAVFCADSISHFWVGKDGALEFVDNHSKRNNAGSDSFKGWKDFRPWERKMVDAIIASKMHVVVTMRTKNEYITEQVNGKTVRRKIGLAPVQREGIEYEFDLVGTMDDENNLMIDKTRCPSYAGQVIGKPGTKDFLPFIEWLKGSPQPVAVVEKGGISEKNELPANGGTAHNAAVQPAPEALSGDVPAELRPIFADISKPGKAREGLKLAKARLEEVMPENGKAEYLRILETHNLKPGGGMQIAEVKAALVEMWTLAEFAVANKKPVFQATDDDLPADLFGNVPVEEEPAYAD